jgi:HAMP domain-containing protein
MGLRAKFNLVLLIVFAISLSATGFVSYRLLFENARASAIRNASVMMEAALAVRNYTIQQIRPLLELQLRREFRAESVPAYAATETFNKLRATYPEYTYKEATLNPTNPRDRATDWEADIVNEFRNSTDKGEIIGVRETATGTSLYLAHPIHIKQEACLECHSTPEAAPQTMIKIYGGANGFGWKLNEIVGAQIVSVPMSVPLEQARNAFYTLMGSLTAVFVLIFIVINVMLGRVIISPLTRMSNLAEEISKGHLDVPELSERRRDEIGTLASAFNRMRRSVEKALKLMEE